MLHGTHPFRYRISNLPAEFSHKPDARAREYFVKVLHELWRR